MSKRKCNEKLQSKEENQIKEKGISCIFLDGRKDNALTQMEINGVKKPSIIKEEHISVCTGDGKYLFHFTPSSPTKEIPAAEQTAAELFSRMQLIGVDKTLAAIGGDSTNTLRLRL